jgi:hypothetical protein
LSHKNTTGTSQAHDQSQEQCPRIVLHIYRTLITLLMNDC